MSEHDSVILLEELYGGDPGIARGMAMYRLAGDVDEGVIVEVGAKHGHTTVALALGSRDGTHRLVYSIDPHDPVSSWTGQTMYGAEDQAPFLRNILKAGVAPLVRILNVPASVARGAFAGVRIGLLFWDTGTVYGPAEALIRSWAELIIPGGAIAINDTADDDMGADAIIAGLPGLWTQLPAEANVRIAYRGRS